MCVCVCVCVNFPFSMEEGTTFQEGSGTAALACVRGCDIIFRSCTGSCQMIYIGIHTVYTYSRFLT